MSKKEIFLYILAATGAVTGVFALIYALSIGKKTTIMQRSLSGADSSRQEKKVKLLDEMSSERSVTKAPFPSNDAISDSSSTPKHIVEADKKIKNMKIEVVLDHALNIIISCPPISYPEINHWSSKKENIEKKTLNYIEKIVRTVGGVSEDELKRCSVETLEYFRFREYHWALLNTSMGNENEMRLLALKVGKAHRQHQENIATVSYTHLTLPTILRV